MNMGTQHFTEDRRGWHVDKGISVSTLLAMGAYTVAIIMWAATVEKNMSLNSYVNDRQNDQLKEVVIELKEQNLRNSAYLDRINAKLEELSRHERNR